MRVIAALMRRAVVRRRAASRRRAWRRPRSRSGPLDAAAVEDARAARVEGAARRDRVQPRHRAVDLRRRSRSLADRRDRAHQAHACRDARAAWITSRTGPISTMRPAYITATRSAVSAITPMSCVTSITAVPCSRHRRFSSAMICAWIETSSAVVGSSATISSRLGAQRQRDHHALAHAAGELVRVVVDALLGAPGCRPPRSSSIARCARLAVADAAGASGSSRRAGGRSCRAG